MTPAKVMPATLREMKQKGEKIPALTVYDYPMARLLDEAGIPLLLVGDSLGMVVLGYPDTTHVTMEEMEHHLRAAARAKPAALLAADLPHKCYETAETAVQNARRLQQTGADAVKAEGGASIINQVRAIVRTGIPFMGHLGMLPQSVLQEGGYRMKGKTEVERRQLMDDAKLLEDAGAFAIVLELVTPAVAGEISRSLSIPTIGIGSGPECDGQVLVTHDLIGLFPWFTPRFVKPRINISAALRDAVAQWRDSIASPVAPVS